MSSNRYRPGRALPRVLLIAAMAGLSFAAVVTVRAQEALPPARTIVDRHVAAIGGREAVLAHSSMRVAGSVSYPGNGISGKFEAFAAKPDKALVKMDIAGIGEALEGFDGTVGWSLSPMTGPMLAQGKELEQKKFDAHFYGELREPERYKSITTIEKTTWDGHPAWKVRLERHDGSEEFEYYHVESGLRTGREFTRESMMGALKVQQTSTDYRKFGDLMVAATSRLVAMNVEQVITISSVEYDKVDPAVFELPAAIKALAKAPADR